MTDRLATIYIIGAGALLALAGALALAALGVPADIVKDFLAVAGMAITLLAPSPLSKSATATDSPPG